jgi:WD40 repeat protein
VLDAGSRERLITIATQPNGSLIAVAGDDGAIRLWNTSGRLLHTLRGHRGVVQRVVFSPDGTTVASAGDDHTARLWDASTGVELRVFMHHSAVRRVAFSPDSRLLASAAREPFIHVWQTRPQANAQQPPRLDDWLGRLTTAETDTVSITSSK